MRNSNITRSLGTVVLAAALMVGLSACGKAETPEPQPTAAPTVQTTVPTTEPTTEPTEPREEPSEAPVEVGPKTKPHGDVNPDVVWGQIDEITSDGQSASPVWYTAEQMPAGKYLIQPHKADGAEGFTSCTVALYTKPTWNYGEIAEKFQSGSDGSGVVTISADTYVVKTTCELRTGDAGVLAKVKKSPEGSTTEPAR